MNAKIIHYTLGILLLLLAVNAFAGGYYGMVGAENVPKEWLEGSPFDDYFIPSLLLFIVVGGSALFAAIMLFLRHRIARRAAFFSVLIVFIWLAVQFAIIGYVSWMQPVTAVAGILIFGLNLIYPKYDH